MQNRSSKLQLIAAELRSSITPSEAALWRLIRGGCLGVRFRRQAVVGRFIVDFVAPAAWLVEWMAATTRFGARQTRAGMVPGPPRLPRAQARG